MRPGYRCLFLVLLGGAFLWPGQARAQSELVVEWAHPTTGEVVVNALRDAILNDTGRPADRVYVLQRGGFYWITDRLEWTGYHLSIVGETEDAVPSGEVDLGPAIIQRVAREDGSAPDGQMFNNSGEASHLTLKNVWIMGQTDQGGLTSYEPFTLNASNSDIVIDNVVFDRNDWHHLGPNARDNDFFVTNSVFRNLFGPSQIWEGLGIRFEVGADTVVFENNTFLNIGFTPFQSEAEPMNYFRANHNTFVNVGRSFQAGALWKEAYITNNLFVNPFWHGENADMYDDPERVDPYTGFFGIAAMPARFGTDFDRQIVLANNSYWRDQRFEDFYSSLNPVYRGQPLVNDTTAGWFERYDAMVMQNNYIGERPDLVTYPTDDIFEKMTNNIATLYGGASLERADLYYWDPGRDEDCLVCNIWPLPEDFSYTNPTLVAGGTDGLPVGDLNWFPAAKASFESNRSAYVTAIEDLAGEPPVLEPVALVQAEAGAVEGDATVESAEGFTHYFMEGSGSIEWTFDLDAAGTFGLNVLTNMRGETQRGQRIIIDGVNLRNNSGFGEYYFCTAAQAGCAVPLPNNEWATVEVRSAGLVEGAEGLILEAGTHTVRIEPSWGWQGFAGLAVVNDADEVVVDLAAPDAIAVGVHEICDDAEYCPQGFSSVALGAGGSIAWTFDVADAGTYMMRIFYQAPGGSVSGDLSTGGQVFTSFSFEGGDAASRDLFTDQFDLEEGSTTITLSTDQGGVNVDYVQLLQITTGPTGVDQDELPEGYALEQNYPNPFNPVTTIEFALGGSGQVSLAVYDVLGRKVATLVDGVQHAGSYRVTFNAAALSSGVYFYRLETPVGARVQTMTVLK